MGSRTAGRTRRCAALVATATLLVVIGLAPPAPARPDRPPRLRATDQAGGSGQEVVIRASVFSPYGAAIGAAGDLFVSDTTRRVVRRSPDGQVAVLGFTGLDEATGVAVGSDGSVFVASNHRVVRLATDGTQADAATGFQHAVGVAVGDDGTLYVVDDVAKEVLAVPPGGSPAPLPFGSLQRPAGIAVGGDGTVYVVDATAQQVLALAPGGAAASPLGFTGLGEPLAVAVDAARTVFVSDGGDPERVHRLPSGGPQSALPLGAGVPTGLAVAADGTLYLAGGNDVGRIGATDGVVAKLAPGASAQEPIDLGGISRAVGVAIDRDGTVFASDCNPYGPCELGTATPEQDFAPLSTPGLHPGPLLAAPDGTLYVSGDEAVTVRGPDGATSQIRFDGVAFVGQLALGPDGSLYALGFVNGRDSQARLLRRKPDGTQTVVVDHLVDPTSLAVAADGTVYLATKDEHFTWLLQTVGADGSLRTVPVAGVAHPQQLALDPGGNLYVAGGDAGFDAATVVQLAPGGGELPVPFVDLLMVRQLVVSGGALYVADEARGVQRLTWERIDTTPPIANPGVAQPATPVRGPSSFTG